MPISVYIDNNVWDYLFKEQLDLAAELPREDFCIAITREAEFEFPPISPEKESLRKFIEATIAKCSVKTDSFFGFNDPTLPRGEQRVGGFNVGRFASSAELDFIKQQKTPLRKRKRMKSKLFKDEADVSLAARSVHSVVLTFDAKRGPIRKAYKKGGKVVFLTEFDKQCLSLRDFIMSKIKCPPPNAE